MRLTQHTDYAFRMLIEVALKSPALITVGEVAQDFNLSAAHLNKVAQTLAAHNYLQTVRGRSGGLRLARDPAAIVLGQVARITEPDFQIAPCMSTEGNCPIYEPCSLRHILADASIAFLTELDRWTLADLVKHPKPLLFAIESVRAS